MMRSTVLVTVALMLTAAAAGADSQSEEQARTRLAGQGIEFTEDAYWAAVMELRADTVILFLDAGMTPDVWRHPPQSDTPLSYAVSGNCHQMFGDEEAAVRIALALIEHGADVNAVQSNSVTPFLEATDGCPMSVIRAMVEHGADVSVRAAGGASPMFYAVWHDNPELATLLLDSGYSLEDETIPLDSMLADKPKVRKVLSESEPAPVQGEPMSGEDPGEEEEEPEEARAGARIGS